MNILIQALEPLASGVDYIFFGFCSVVSYCFRFVEIGPLIIDTVVTFLKFLLALNRIIVEFIVGSIAATITQIYNIFTIFLNLLYALCMSLANVPPLMWNLVSSLLHYLLSRINNGTNIFILYLVKPMINAPAVGVNYFYTIARSMSGKFYGGSNKQDTLEDVLYVGSGKLDMLEEVVGSIVPKKSMDDIATNVMSSLNVEDFQKELVQESDAQSYRFFGLFDLFQWLLLLTVNSASWLGEKILLILTVLFDIFVIFLNTALGYILGFFEMVWNCIFVIAGFVTAVFSLMHEYVIDFFKMLWNLVLSMNNIASMPYSIWSYIYIFVSHVELPPITVIKWITACFFVLATILICRQYSLYRTITRINISQRLWPTIEPVKVCLTEKKKRCDDNMEDWTLCVICKEEHKSVLLLPCRHLCLCGACVDYVLRDQRTGRKCPLCRTVITDNMSVYL